MICLAPAVPNHKKCNRKFHKCFPEYNKFDIEQMDMLSLSCDFVHSSFEI